MNGEIRTVRETTKFHALFHPLCQPAGLYLKTPAPDVMPKVSFSITASPLGEEEPGPKGAERGGYLPIPRRDARAGEWDFWRRFSGAELAAAAREPEGSESLSVIIVR